MSERQVLSASQMRDAEQALFDAGMSVSDLMEIAAGGAAEWVRRIAGGRSVTVLCGPGNNGGDGYVIARRLREAGNAVQIVAPMEPKTDAAKTARKLWGAAVETSGGEVRGEVLVDCLFGTGLARPLEPEHALLLRDLAGRHTIRIAIDLPSGVDSDSGALLNDRLPTYTATIALGAWKFAHWSLPARAQMGVMRLIPIGIEAIGGAAQLIARPKLRAPKADAHKYTRGLLAVVGGEMQGAGLLASEAAQRSGAGYVKLLTEVESVEGGPALVIERGPLSEALADDRIKAMLVGPGLGRSEKASQRLSAVMSQQKPVVLDGDALVLLRPEMLSQDCVVLATPHDGELDALCRSFSVIAEGRKERAVALARVSGMIVCAKGPDTIIASPKGDIAIAPSSTSWLSVAGSGDVLAGIAASRMACGADPFPAACEAVWLHGEAARRCGAFFTAFDLAHAVSDAASACL